MGCASPCAAGCLRGWADRGVGTRLVADLEVVGVRAGRLRAGRMSPCGAMTGGNRSAGAGATKGQDYHGGRGDLASDVHDIPPFCGSLASQLAKRAVRGPFEPYVRNFISSPAQPSPGPGGSSIRTRAPLSGWLSATARPPWARAIDATIAR